MTADPWRATPGGIAIACRLTPKGGRDAIEGVATLSNGGRVLLARVRSAAEDGKANDALCRMIAEMLRVPSSSVRVIAGTKSRLKRLAATGQTGVLMARLEALHGAAWSATPG